MTYNYTSNDEPIMSLTEQAIIVDWVKSHFMYFKINGKGKYFQEIHLFDDLPECVYEIKKRIFDKEQLHEYEQEPIFKDSIGYMVEDAKLHLHIDPNPINSNLIHTRYNVYVQLPEKGGYPIYRNMHCKIKERRYICCRSGLDYHMTEQVEGHRERIVISFGVLVPKERIDNINYNYDYDV